MCFNIGLGSYRPELTVLRLSLTCKAQVRGINYQNYTNIFRFICCWNLESFDYLP